MLSKPNFYLPLLCSTQVLLFVVSGSLQAKENANITDEVDNYYEKGMRGASAGQDNLPQLKLNGDNNSKPKIKFSKPKLENNKKAEKFDHSNYKLAAKYYDMFWKNCPKSCYKTEVAIAGLAALRAENRGSEALARLKQVIKELSIETHAPGLRQATTAYSNECSIQSNTLSRLLGKYTYKSFKFSRNKPTSKLISTRSSIGSYRLLRINDLNKELKQLKANERWVATLRPKKQHVCSPRRIDQLNNFFLVSIGENLFNAALTIDSKTGIHPAARFFEQALTNRDKKTDSSYIQEAVIGLAKIYQPSTGGEKLQTAYLECENIYNGKNGKLKHRSEALLHMLLLAKAKGDHVLAIKNGEAYLTEFKASKEKTKVRSIMADSYLQSGDKKRAIGFFIELTEKAYQKNFTKLSKLEQSQWQELKKKVSTLKGLPEVQVEIKKLKIKELE